MFGRRRLRTRTPLWLKIGRRLFSKWVWSGAGVITRKFHRPMGIAEGASIMVSPRGLPGNVSGVVPERWLLVLIAPDGGEHYVNVAPAVWETHEVGDAISANNPLVDVTV